jgi:threonine/homoserine/homoserine lactone efflux protein
MIVQVFGIAFIVSFLGSVPPGMVNVSVMQMAIKKHKRAAIFFALSASLVEFVYAGLTVKFQIFLQESTVLSYYFHFITAAALVVVGTLSLNSKVKSQDVASKDIARGREGFSRGIAIGLLNPMTIPFWLMVTAYMQNHDLIGLAGLCYWAYLSGLTSGTFVLLLVVMWLGNRFTRIADNHLLVHKVPGFLLIGLGVYNFITWAMEAYA